MGMAAPISEAAAKKMFLSNSLKPLVPYVNSMTPWKSQCLKCKKIVSPNYNKVRLRGHQCGYCAGTLVDPKDAVKLMSEFGFKPIVPYPGSNLPWDSRCLKCKKVTSPTYSNVAKGIGCKFCSKRAVDPKDAVAAMKKRGFKTLEPFPGAVAPWRVQCLTCKKKFEVPFHSLSNKSRCKFCSNIAVDEAELLARLKELKLNPLEKYQTAKTPWRCKCLVCGYVVQPTWSRIKSGRGHCAYCANRRIDGSKALKIMKSAGLKPLVDFPGSNKPWKCKCLVCGLETSPRWSGIQRGQGGCSNCADWGLNYGKPGYIYLITHEKFGAHKIGIANSYKSKQYDDRMYQHERQGWVLYKKVSFPTVQQASDIETSVLKWLRLQVGLPFFLTANQMPKGGHTETVDASEIDLPTIWEKVEELSKVKK